VDPREVWPAFAERVRARLEAGAREYGSRSLQRPLVDIADEVEQELADVCGWSAVMVARMRGLSHRLQELDGVQVVVPQEAPSASPEYSADTHEGPLRVYLRRETIELLRSLCLRYQAPPGEVIHMALRLLERQMLEPPKQQPPRQLQP
jgi:hypothetical protein